MQVIIFHPLNVIGKFMKTLYLVRHAKSSWNHPELTDIKRPLNKRGKRDAPFMGNLLAKGKIKVDQIISSPAIRAYSTAKIFASAIGYPLENINLDKNIYEADSYDLLQIIHGLDNKIDFVMLFGHNPGLTELYNKLSNKPIGNLPTCAATAIEFDIKYWEEVETFTGKLKFFEYPKKYFKK